MTPAQREGWRRAGWVGCLGWIAGAMLAMWWPAEGLGGDLGVVVGPPLALILLFRAVGWVRRGFGGDPPPAHVGRLHPALVRFCVDVIGLDAFRRE